MDKKEILFISLFILGFLWRLFLSQPVITENFYDMASYSRMAKEILAGRLTSDCCDHNIGYGAFLAVVYKAFGVDNYQAVRLIQIFLDLASAWLIYKSAEKLLGKTTAVYSLGLYIINPFTSSYAGLRLAEISTIFYVSLIAYIITWKNFLLNKKLWFALGLLLGLLLFTRASSYYPLLGFFLFVNLSLLLKKRNFDFLFFIVLGFLLTSFYTLMSNFRHYQIFSLTPPYNIGSSGLYINFFNDRYPELLSEKEKVNPEFAKILLEYHTTYYTDIPSFREKYKKLFWERIATDWPKFLYNQGRNIFWIWDKYHLGYYYDQYYPADVIPLRVVNLISLTLFFIGIIGFTMKGKWQAIQNPLFIFTVLLFASITFLFTLISNETRHSLYFYPLLYLWAGYGFTYLS